MSLTVNPAAGVEAAALGAPNQNMANADLPGGGFVPNYFWSRPVLFAANVAAGAKLALATLVDASLEATAKDAFLRTKLGFTIDNPPILARLYAVRVHVGTSTVAASVPPSEANVAELAEQLVISTGNPTNAKRASLGLSVGSTFPGKGVSTTQNNVRVDVAGRLGRWFPLAFNGDVLNLQAGDLLELNNLQAFTAEAMRLELEVCAEWVAGGSADWLRGPCVDLKAGAPWKQRFRDLFPREYAECYPRLP
jgi:hypothetical protein